MTLVLFLTTGCGATPLGAPGTGGTTTGPGYPSTGGAHSATGAGGSGGAHSATGAGGTSVVACTTPPKVSVQNCGSPKGAIGSFKVRWPYYNYMVLDFGTFAGFAYVFISPTPNPSDTFVCDNSFAPTTEDRDEYTDALCGAGTVPADCTGNAVGGIGFNLNQVQWGSASKDSPFVQPTLPVLGPDLVACADVTVTFVNRANSDLRIQIAQHSDRGSVYYCRNIAGVPSPVTVAASQFTERCWDSIDPGARWDGTDIESIALIIPSQKSKATPFEACMLNVELRWEGDSR